MTDDGSRIVGLGVLVLGLARLRHGLYGEGDQGAERASSVAVYLFSLKMK